MKIGLGLREAWGRQSERNRLCLKNCLDQSLKTKNTCFLLVNFSQSYSWKMPLKHTKIFVGSLYSWNSHESFYLTFGVFIFCLTHFREKSLLACFSRKCLWSSFWWKTWKIQLNKNSKHESIRTLPKTYNILKKNFGFYQQAIEYTHHIWTRIITQMK